MEGKGSRLKLSRLHNYSPFCSPPSCWRMSVLLLSLLFITRGRGNDGLSCIASFKVHLLVLLFLLSSSLFGCWQMLVILTYIKKRSHVNLLSATSVVALMVAIMCRCCTRIKCS